MFKKIIDAHCHIHNIAKRLLDEKLVESLSQSILENILQRAVHANVTHIVSCATYPDDWDLLETVMSNMSQENKLPHIVPSFGLHPWWANYGLETMTWDLLRQKLQIYPTANVGEIGLCKSSRGQEVDMNVQEYVFETQLVIATELQRPCIIHCVGACGKLLSILHSVASKRGTLPPAIIFHSYSGSGDMIPAFLALEKKGTEIYFSFNVKQLSSENNKIVAACKRTPPSKLLVETDAPDQLPSDEMRQKWITDELCEHNFFQDCKVNEPCFVQIAVHKVAQIRGEYVDNVARTLYENSCKAFCLNI